MAATISHLQHACLTAPWAVRVASVQALAKVHTHALPPAALSLVLRSSSPAPKSTMSSDVSFSALPGKLKSGHDVQVAVRSNEPYRLQCYSFLSALSLIGGLGKPGHSAPLSFRWAAESEMPGFAMTHAMPSLLIH